MGEAKRKEEAQGLNDAAYQAVAFACHQAMRGTLKQLAKAMPAEGQGAIDIGPLVQGNLAGILQFAVEDCGMQPPAIRAEVLKMMDLLLEQISFHVAAQASTTIEEGTA